MFQVILILFLCKIEFHHLLFLTLYNLGIKKVPSAQSNFQF